jgi:hypothetical protein
MLPDVETLTADKSYDPTRAMVVMHPERFSPDEASRPAFHREPSAGCPQHSETLYRQRHKRREHVRKAKRLAAGGWRRSQFATNAASALSHPGNCYLLAWSMSPDLVTQAFCDLQESPTRLVVGNAAESL